MALWGICLPSTFRLHVINPKSWKRNGFLLYLPEYASLATMNRNILLGNWPTNMDSISAMAAPLLKVKKFHHHVSDGIEASTGGCQHPFQTQLFRRGQFNPACLQSGRFYGNFERRLIAHERHHEKFLPGPSQYEPHIDIIGNQMPVVYQIEMQFTSNTYSCHRYRPTFLWPYTQSPG